MAAAIHEERRLIRHPTLWRGAAATPLATTTAGVLDVSAVPHEVLLHVASYLDRVQDLLSFGAVCKATLQVSLDEALWQRLCVSTFPLPSPDRAPPGGWKALYRFNHGFFYDVLVAGNLDAVLNAAYPRLWTV